MIKVIKIQLKKREFEGIHAGYVDSKCTEKEGSVVEIRDKEVSYCTSQFTCYYSLIDPKPEISGNIDPCRHWVLHQVSSVEEIY